MGYTALYRKFRPTTFDDVVGQDQVIKVLKHQIQNNQINELKLNREKTRYDKSPMLVWNGWFFYLLFS